VVFNNLGDFTSVSIPKRAAAKANRMTLSGDLYSCTVAIKTIKETNSTLVCSMKKSLEKLKYVKIDYQESKVLANIRSLEKQIKLSSKEILDASKQGNLNELIDKQLFFLDYYVKFFNNYKIFYPERNLSKEILLKVVLQLINFQKDQSNHNSHLSLKVNQEKFIGKIKKEQNQLFHLSKHLGSGKSANVYEALDINTGNILAYKTSRLGDHDAFISIDNEYKILDILNSHGKVWGIQNKPHSVYQVIDKGQHNIGYLGEKFDGDLINAVDLSCDFTSPEIFESNLFIAHQLLAALKYTQSKGVLHGDIKPDNILTKQGLNGVIVCLADWGNAKKVDQPLDVLIENIVYTSPYFHRVSQSDTEEMKKSKPKFIEVQQKRDVFAMGTTLYQLFSGRKPYPLDENNFPITREGYTRIFNLPDKINQLLQGMLEFNKIRVSIITYLH
jgi:RIO-like serine/threonine protein kinase